ncbi:unnamed protein product [Amoebophrya sp. A120]|nr:unnamed protein product [Amoebophrya sp. A120]|eukprot:GSA120T00003772001.1
MKDTYTDERQRSRSPKERRKSGSSSPKQASCQNGGSGSVPTTRMASITKSVAGKPLARPYSRLRLALVRHGESCNNVHESTGDALTYWKYRSPDPDLTERGHQQAALLAKHLADEKKSQFWGMHPISELWVSPVKRAMQTIRPLSQTKVRRNGGPYFGEWKTEMGIKSAINGGNARYVEEANRLSCFERTASPAEYAKMEPLLQLRAFEEGGLFQREVIVDDKTGEFSLTEQKAVGGLTKSQIQRDFPGYQIPKEVTEKGWYVPQTTPTETHAESRHRAYEFAKMLKKRAAGLAAPGAVRQSDNIVLVAHFDFITQLLASLLHFESKDPTVKEHGALMLHNGVLDGIWFRHFNTGVTVVDILGGTGQAGIVLANSIDHLRDHPELVSGFSLGNVAGVDTAVQ